MSRSACAAPPLAALSLAALLAAPVTAGEVETLHYGVELGGKRVGYSELHITPPAQPGAPRAVETRSFLALSLLGQEFDVSTDARFEVEPESGRVLRYEGRTKTGEMTSGAQVEVAGARARVTPLGGGAPREVELPPDARLDDSAHFDFLLEELSEPGAVREFPTFSFETGDLHDVEYTRRADEELTLEGSPRACAVFDWRAPSMGVSGTLWVELDGALVFRASMSTGVVVSRAPAAEVGKIKRAELDDLLLAPVDVAIADFRAIDSMRVRARLRAAGGEVSPESLNVPGQRFEGSVEDGLVEGVFEIAWPRYDGSDAPPFPPALPDGAALVEALDPEPLIESDDPLLVDLARERTAGAEDSWDAVRRLSQWVADEIGYSIPGGSARQTFDSRTGECASHTRLLVALCRGVGIPARVVTGGMYTPNLGGSFGQHVWTEVHMGVAGWVPVDPTADEADYVDSGHIRLGTGVGFQPEELEVLAHTLAGAAPAPAVALGDFDPLPWAVGESVTYRYEVNGAPLGSDQFTLEAREQDGERVALAFHTRLELDGRIVDGTTRVDGHGRPLAYHVEGRAGDVEYEIDCRFEPGRVVERVVQSGRESERTIELPDEVFLLDNNNFCHYALLCSALPLEPGARVELQAFHPSSMQVLPVEVTVLERETIELAAGPRQCTACRLVIAGTPLELWIDDAGRVLREREGGGRLVLELVE